MEVVKGVPYFCKSENKCKQYPYFEGEKKADILIVGGGIDGAIANYYLSEKYNCVLVEKDRIGCGCTSCATVLLEYQLDDFAHELDSVMSEREIISVYRMGLDSIEEIAKLIKTLGNKCHFSKRPSMLFSNKITDIPSIKKEYKFRQKHGFNVQYINADNNPYPFELKAGILAPDGGAELNAYLFTKQLIEASSNQSQIFENTKVESVENIDDKYHVYMNYGDKIIVDKIIYATGFNFEQMPSDNMCERYVTYSLVTKPIEGLSFKNNALMQDSGDPYHYFRMLPDNRLIYGGEDTKFSGDTISESVAKKKYEKLNASLIKMLKQYESRIAIDYEFSGVFGQTDNNLGLIGEGEGKNIFYFTSCGANGIINSFCGAKLVDDIIQNKQNIFKKLFDPNRYITDK